MSGVREGLGGEALRWDDIERRGARGSVGDSTVLLSSVHPGDKTLHFYGISSKMVEMSKPTL